LRPLFLLQKDYVDASSTYCDASLHTSWLGDGGGVRARKPFTLNANKVMTGMSRTPVTGWTTLNAIEKLSD